MKSPSVWTLQNLMNYVKSKEAQASRDGNNWFPARPMGYPMFFQRIRLAWLVFTGKADAVIWPEGQ